MTINRNKFPSAFAVCPSRQLWRIARRGSGRSEASRVHWTRAWRPHWRLFVPCNCTTCTPRYPLQCLHPMPDPPPRFVIGQDDSISHSFTDPSPRYSIESTFQRVVSAFASASNVLNTLTPLLRALTSSSCNALAAEISTLKPKSQIYPCCQTSWIRFQTRREMNQSVTGQMLVLNPNKIESERYNCPSCSKSFVRKAHMLRHQQQRVSSGAL